jgi:hypothetical protein
MDSGNRLKKKAWWEKAPRSLNLGPGGKKRAKDEIYHFLLPDKAMLSSAGIKMLAEAHDSEKGRVRDWMRDFTRPFKESERRLLRHICDAIDAELERYHRFLQRLNSKTASHYDIFAGIQEKEQGELKIDSYEKKEELAAERFQKNASYFKLKLVMDYWSAFWFWDMREAAELPDRQQYLNDLINILKVDIPRTDAAGALEPAPKLFNMQGDQLSLGAAVQDGESTTDAIIRQVPHAQLFGERRLKIVQELARTHRFFHPQLEFLDLICGNPPWISVAFAEDGVVSEEYPEVFVRKWSATKTSKAAKKLVSGNEKLYELYAKEAIEAQCTKEYIGAQQNYPLISGGRNNLYKCILENGFSLTGPQGYMGLLHPEGVYDDPKGQKLRRALYPRLAYHFEFKNGLFLFSEVHDQKNYSVNIYAGNETDIDFISIHNLFHPTTVYASFVHEGHGLCAGIKVMDEQAGRMVWNTEGHRDRLVRIREKELRILARAFEDSEEWKSAKLVSVHSQQIMSVLEKLSTFPTKVSDFENKVTDCWNEVTAQKDGIIRRETRQPDLNKYEMIYSGPHFFVGNPLYKMPREICEQNSHYDEIDLTQIPEDYLPRTNYVPDEDLQTYVRRVKGFPTLWDKDGKPVEWDRWIDYYKVCFSKMLSIAGERSLQPAIIPPKVAHIFGAISAVFKSNKNVIELAALSASVVSDFYIKTMGVANLTDIRLQNLPNGVKKKYIASLFVRILNLNCLTTPYAELWENNWQEGFAKETWSKADPRLPAFSRLSREWQWDIALRTAYARRQALVEIDVLVAQALGLSLEELMLIYEVQFPVLQQNEADTWYDQNGHIVFTSSRGLTGTGVDRPTWNSIRNLKAGETHTHTIDPGKSELYGGQHITYHAPYDRCDRVEDYKIAWKYFEKVMGED